MNLDELSIEELWEELEAAEMSCDGNREAAVLEELELRRSKVFEMLGDDE